MEFTTWNPVYERILADFGFDRAADERARDVLASLVESFDIARLAGFEGATVVVAGAGPSLSDEAPVAVEGDYVVAASTAADVLREAGVGVDVVVTDLDKNPESTRTMSREGTVVAAHAHGDNLPAVREWVPQFAAENVLGTTQAEPAGPVYNFGGFTDGDRAAFLADALGAAELVFLGWDFDDPSVSSLKEKKLRWAERLLFWLEHRRGERFEILDDRRDRLTLPTD